MLDRSIHIVREQIESLLRAVEAPDHAVQNQYQIRKSIENSEIMLDKTLALEQQLLVKGREYTQNSLLMAENALNALREGKDDLAKKAIQQQLNDKQNAEEFEKMSEMAKKATNGIKKSLVRLEEKLVKVQHTSYDKPFFENLYQSKTSNYNGINRLNEVQEKVSSQENELLIEGYKDSVDREFEAFFKNENLKKAQEALIKEEQAQKEKEALIRQEAQKQQEEQAQKQREEEAQKQREKSPLKSFFKKYF